MPTLREAEILQSLLIAGFKMTWGKQKQPFHVAALIKARSVSWQSII